MSRCLFERPLVRVRGALQRVKDETIARGGSFEGDYERGRYTMRTPFGSIEGTYLTTDRMVRFSIVSKPALVPCAWIERVVDQYLGP